MRNIIAGPWAGEMGWELMRWQGIFRKIKQDHPDTKIVMAARPGHEALYRDYIEEYIPYEAEGGETDGWRLNGGVPLLPPSILKDYPRYTYLNPLACMRNLPMEFIKYGVADRDQYSFDIVIHGRNTDKAGTGYRNWPLDKWADLCSLFGGREDIAFIGSEDSVYVPGYYDYRGRSLDEVCDIIASAKIVIGPSSGPMHLASLCGTPHCIWSDKKFWGSCNGTNRQRYEENWNPLGTKAIVIDEYDWQPTVQVVCDTVMEHLDDS